MVTTEFERRVVGTPSRVHQMRSKVAPVSKDVAIDRWVSRIFSIISSGPAGGFVSYAVGPRNDLFVVHTGNRHEVGDIVTEMLPKDACRYLAYNLKYQRNGIDQAKVVWFVWTPDAAPKQESIKYLNGLASALIGLKCHATIPILSAKDVTELEITNIMAEVS